MYANAILRQDREEVIGPVIRAVGEYFDGLARYLSSRAERFVVVEHSIIPDVEIKHRYKLGQNISSLAKFRFFVNFHLESSDGEFASIVQKDFGDYKVEDFELDSPIDPKMVCTWGGTDVASGVMSELVAAVVSDLSSSLMIRFGTVEQRVHEYGVLGEFIRLFHEFIDGLPHWRGMQRYNVYRSFRDHTRSILRNTLMLDMEDGTDFCIRILRDIGYMSSSRSPLRMELYNLEKNVVYDLHEFLSRFAVGAEVKNGKNIIPILRKMSEVFQGVRLYEDVEGLALSLRMTDVTTKKKETKEVNMYFLRKNGKLVRSNANTNLAKRFKILNDLG